MATVDKILTLLEKQMTGDKEFKGFQSFLEPLKGEMKSWSNESRSALSATAQLADAVMGFGSKAGSTLPVIGQVTTAFAKTMGALSDIGVKAARTHVDQEIKARSVGTTRSGIDWLSNVYKMFRLDQATSKKWAQESAGATSGVINDAQKGNKQALAKLNLANIDAFETGKIDPKTGKPVTTSDPKRGKARPIEEVAAEAMRQGEIFRRMAEEATDKKNWKAAQEYRNRAEAAFYIAGLDKTKQARIADQNVQIKDFPERLEEQNSLNPLANGAQDAEKKKLDAQNSESDNNFNAAIQGFNNRVEQAGVAVGGILVPLKLAISKSTVVAAKASGLIETTEAERQKAQEQEKAFDAELRTKNPRLADYYKNKEGATGVFDMGLLNGEPASDKPKTLSEKISELQMEGGGAGLPDMAQLMSSMDGDMQLQKAQVLADQQMQQAGYNNVGNDQRQMPMTVNMNISANTAPEMVNAVQQAIRMAPSLAKESNTSTAASPTP